MNAKRSILLVGTGQMGIEYTKVLKAMKKQVTAIGRSEESVKNYHKATGVPGIPGGVYAWLKSKPAVPKQAIVAVSENELGKTAIALLEHGVTSILLEKPGGFTVKEIQKVTHTAKKKKARVFVAYNRRFYASVMKAEEIIRQDGGVTSANFEFTEWSHVIATLKKAPGVREHWFLHNSTHVIDLAFFLAGQPKKMKSFTSGKLVWHPSGAVFAGAGVTTKKALFSYQANWAAPGRWGLEVLTKKHRLIFRPLEKLSIQNIGSVQIEEVPLQDTLDLQFKPGLYKQVESFLTNSRNRLCSITEQSAHIPVYLQINRE